MKKILINAIIIVSAIFSAQATDGVKKVNSEESNIHVNGSKFNGTFTTVNGEIHYNSAFSIDSVRIIVSSMEVGGIKTKLQEDHLKSEKWLYSEVYNTITFVSTSVEPKDEGQYLVKGNMTIMNTTREIEVMVNEEEIDGHKVFKGEFPIHRKEYKVGPDGGVLEEVLITLHIVTE